MGDKSTIQWTDATWNPIVGCSVISPGCKRCYAMKMARRIVLMAQGSGKVSHYEPTVNWGSPDEEAVWTGAINNAPPKIFDAPLRWKNPRRIFVNSMGDLHHEQTPIEWIDDVVRIMAKTPQHTYQVLTKRAEGMLAYWSDPDLPGRVGAAVPLPNVWLGVSAERQKEADERVPHLLRTPAAVRFVSAEPLIGPIDIVEFHPTVHGPGVDWIIVGGESGRGARPFLTRWAEDILAQSAAGEIAVFVKQLGSNPYRESCSMFLKDGHGGDPNEWPTSLRVREFPRAAA